MPDIENLLRSTLEDVGSGFEPSDTPDARERFLQRKRARRFRLVLSGVAVTAAAVAAALFVYSVPATDEPEDASLPPAAASAPQPVATIAVGEGPVSIDASDAGVWVAESDSASVSEIDPTGNRVARSISVAAPDELAISDDGTLWVAHADGAATRLYVGEGSVGSASSETFPLADDDEVHLDLAATDAGMIGVDPSTGQIYEVSSDPEGRVTGRDGRSPRHSGAFSATDVATDGNEVWFLDGRAGEVLPLPTLTTGLPLADELAEVDSTLPTLEGGANADLAVDEGTLWVANGDGGTIYRIDLEAAEEPSTILVGGEHTDLAVGGGFLWALTGAPDEPSVLRQIDRASGEVVGEPLTLDGRPTDVTFSAGSAWVTDGDGDRVIKIRPAF